MQKVFEPGALDVDVDLKRYTQDYQRVRAKVIEKSASTDTQKSGSSGDKTPTASSSATPVESVPVETNQVVVAKK